MQPLRLFAATLPVYVLLRKRHNFPCCLHAETLDTEGQQGPAHRVTSLRVDGEVVALPTMNTTDDRNEYNVLTCTALEQSSCTTQ